MSRLSDFYSTLTVAWLMATAIIIVVVTHFIDCMHQFKMLNRFHYTSENVFAARGSMDWIGCGSEHGYTSWTGSDWIESVSLWIGLDWIYQNGPLSNAEIIRHVQINFFKSCLIS